MAAEQVSQRFDNLWHVQDLDALGSLPKLTHLSMLDNEVAKQPSYRRASQCPRAAILMTSGARQLR